MRPNFNVVVQRARGEPVELELQITRNGYQWQVVTLEPDEAKMVWEALHDYLAINTAAVCEPNKEKP